MRHGKMKTLFGLYKVLGREMFLESARNYSNHVHDTVEATLAEMESRWFDKAHTITEAEKMVSDYNRGVLMGYDEASYQSVPALKMEALA